MIPCLRVERTIQRQKLSIQTPQKHTHTHIHNQSISVTSVARKIIENSCQPCTPSSADFLPVCVCVCVCLPVRQGLPPGHTTPCYPVSIPGIRQHRVLSAAKDSDADSQARARFALLGNAVTVQVGAGGGGHNGMSTCGGESCSHSAGGNHPFTDPWSSVCTPSTCCHVCGYCKY
jgi:hypothetical protein